MGGTAPIAMSEVKLRVPLMTRPANTCHSEHRHAAPRRLLKERTWGWPVSKVAQHGFGRAP
jgi:hypothetical protein